MCLKKTELQREKAVCPPKTQLILSSPQVRRSPNTSATMRRVSPARRVTIPRACSAWRRPAPTPMTPPACATTATSGARSRSGASPAPCARWVRACCTAASSTTTRCARSATRTRTRTRRAPGSPASPAPPAKGTTPSVLAPQPLIRSVRVSQFPCGDIVTIQASCFLLVQKQSVAL